jgi:hypothetical protein
VTPRVFEPALVPFEVEFCVSFYCVTLAGLPDVHRLGRIAAMALLAPELVGPYADRIATFLEYPLDRVRVIGARLHGAKIWEDDEVHYECWSDPQKGGVAFLLDLMVAEGKLIRNWSEEKKQYAYREPDIREVSRLVV